MRVSFCIATHNALEYTRKCFEVLPQTLQFLNGDYEIIVVDDVSTDGSVEYLKSLSSPFRVHLNKEKKGFAYNNNLAAGMASGEYLCLINNDTIPQKGWLEPMLRIFETHERVGLVGNVHWNPRTGRFDHMGMVLSAQGVPQHFGRYWRFVPFQGYREWKAVTAACWVVKNDFFQSLGGFDTSYLNGCEDIDFCFRVQQAGRKCMVSYESLIHHFVSVSPGRADRNKVNEQLLLQRWQGLIDQNFTTHEARLSGLNYLGKFIDRPWRYHLPTLGLALKQVLLGH